MKSYILALSAGGLTAVSLLVGVVHGRLTNRWGPQPDMEEASRRLESMPEDIEGWHCDPHSPPLDERVKEMLQCQGSLNRVYENVKTGQTVSVVVLLGPAGPISVHTPEICYSSQDYQIASDRVAYTIDSQQDLWDLRLKAKEGGAPLRVLYAWTNDGNWDATANPRFAFGGRPLLYKIQLAGPVPNETSDQDACRDFLDAFLPVLRKHLIAHD
jgi:hypothetical protein